MKRFFSIGAVTALLTAQTSFAMAPVSMPAPMHGLTVTVHGPSVPQSVSPGSQGIPMLALDLQNDASSGAKLETIRVLHRGLGDRRDLLGVYLVSPMGERLSDRFSFARDGLAEIRVWPPLDIPSGQMMAVTIVADIAPDAALAGEHRLWVSSDADIDAGDTDVMVKQGVASVGFVRTAGPQRSSIDVDYPGLNERVRYGENRLVGRIRLSADGRENQLVSSITLTNAGKARGDDLQRIYIESSRGQRLTNVAAALDGRTKDAVTLTFATPLRLEGGSSLMLNIRANALASRRRTIQLIVEEPGDVMAGMIR